MLPSRDAQIHAVTQITKSNLVPYILNQLLISLILISNSVLLDVFPDKSCSETVFLKVTDSTNQTSEACNGKILFFPKATWISSSTSPNLLNTWKAKCIINTFFSPTIRFYEHLPYRFYEAFTKEY